MVSAVSAPRRQRLRQGRKRTRQPILIGCRFRPYRLPKRFFRNLTRAGFVEVYPPVYSLVMNTTATDSILELEFIPLFIIEELTVEEVIQNQPPKNPPPATGKLPDIVTGDRFLKINYPPRRELIDGLLHQGTKLLLAGASKAGKTWLLLAMAIAVATGEKWLGLATKRARVLFINLEILPDFFQERCLLVKEKMGLKSLGWFTVWNLRGYETDIDKMVEHVLARFEQDGGYDLVVIDPVYKCYGGRDENNAGDMANFLSHLERIAATTGAAVVFSTHYSKGNQATKNVLDRTSGSGVFARDADTYLSVTEHEKDLHFSVESVVRNGAPVPAFVLRKEFPLFFRDDSLDPMKLKRSNRRAAPAVQSSEPATVGRKPKFSDNELLSLLPTTGLTYGEWENAAKDALGCSETTFKERRRKLTESGAITLEKGHYTRTASGQSGDTDSSGTVLERFLANMK